MSGLCRGVLPIFALEPPMENMNCFLSKQMENQCGVYCHKAMKPLLEMAHQSLQKDVRLADLVEQLADLKLQLSVYKERESKNRELLEVAANVVAIREQLSNMESKFQNRFEQQTTEKVLIEEPNKCTSSGTSSNLQKIKVPGMEPFLVSCNNEIAGPGWTLIQQRLNGSRSFYRSWDAYREGFGDINNEFFIGLEKLHRILISQPHELYIRMEHINNKINYAHYDNFKVGDENSGYKLLSLGNYSGNSTDALRRNLGMKFTTYDHDNDVHRTVNCARIHNDAWWHAACSDSNLNGIYNDATRCIYWYFPSLKSNSDCLKTVQMLIRPKAS
ncbi:hypothetical protein ACLKA7_013481 [Drosophila subpalustris]